MVRRALLPYGSRSALVLCACLWGCLDGHEPKAGFGQRWRTFGRTRVLLAGGTDGRGGGDGPVLVYLHGFASLAEDQLPLRDDLDVPAGTRFVFPEGPLPVTIPEGPRRAWWLLDRPFRHRLRAEPLGMRELAGREPGGLERARARIRDVLDGVERTMAPPERTVLAGFSQGAMLACDVMLEDGRPLAGAALLSGTLIASQRWAPRMGARAGLPVFMTHGRRDPLLPYPMAERLAALLTERGVDLRWHPHGEGHHFNPAIAPALSAFLYETLAADRLEPVRRELHAAR